MLNCCILSSNQVMKPMLERKRRARINRCLDELKELMSAALASEGENLTKLEKADVLELTVRHLHQLHREGELTLAAAASGLFGAPLRSGGASGGGAQPVPALDRRRYQGGFLACAQQVASYVMKTPGLEPGLGQRLLAHLAHCSAQISADSGASAPTAGVMHPSVMPLMAPESPSPSPFVLPLSHLVAHPATPTDYSGAHPARQYAITAQLQLYRHPQPLASCESAPHSGARHVSPHAAPEADRSDDDSGAGSPLKRRYSPDPCSIAHVPKKRYTHLKFDGADDTADAPAASPPPPSLPEASTPPTPPSPAPPTSGCYVVESRIVQLSPEASSADAPPADAKDADCMWRPW